MRIQNFEKVQIQVKTSKLNLKKSVRYKDLSWYKFDFLSQCYNLILARGKIKPHQNQFLFYIFDYICCQVQILL